ncbi:TlpA disulfide reductase family protein [Chryseobacterium sp. NRRL B-14859]|uniref:TlpA family protein disulfide reductase n=1 Tax=Chryseobacterium sp. NRRL B-14859 TaxID=1562763 RepID=UPI003395761F
MKTIISLILFSCSIVLTAQKQHFKTFPDMENKLETHFPIEIFKDKNGEKYPIGYLEGKTTFINLWSTTCAPCLEELPILNQLKKSLPEVHFIGITYDTAEKVNSFLSKHDFNFDQISDAGQQLKSYLTIQRFPMSFIIGKDGNIKTITGVITEEKVNFIKEMLKE